MATAKEQKWLEAYLQCFNATKAARVAGYAWPSRKGSEKKLKFAAEIERRLALDAMTSSEVLSRLARQARLDLGDFVTADDDGTPRFDWRKVEKERATGTVKSIVQTAHGIKVEFHDAQVALVHLGRALDLFSGRLRERQDASDAPAPTIESTSDIVRLLSSALADVGKFPNDARRAVLVAQLSARLLQAFEVDELAAQLERIETMLLEQGK